MIVLKFIGALFYLLFSFSVWAGENDWRARVSDANKVEMQNFLCLAWVDLQGADTQIEFQYPRRSSCIKPQGMSFPALFVMGAGNDKVTRAQAFVERDNQFIAIWEAVLASPHLRAINAINLQVAATGKFLDISLFLTVVPGKEDVPFMPGPPMQQLYHYTGGRYELTD